MIQQRMKKVAIVAMLRNDIDTSREISFLVSSPPPPRLIEQSIFFDMTKDCVLSHRRYLFKLEVKRYRDREEEILFNAWLFAYFGFKLEFLYTRVKSISAHSWHQCH